MKICPIYPVLLAVAMGSGAVYRFQRPEPEIVLRKHILPQTPKAPPETVQGKPEPSLDFRAILPEPVKESATPVVTAHVQKPKPMPSKPSREGQQRIAAKRYWQNATKNFERQRERLDKETNPARRWKTIQSMARHVRIDTPSALDWAMGLENPKEKRAALEAINKHALSGIGARIEMDETGVPRIRETTVLSAIGSTGLVESGDYISGMVKGDGSTVYFKGLPLGKIVQHLRGQPGSEVTLVMERTASNGGAPYAFHVPVQRSMLVVQPPF